MTGSLASVHPELIPEWSEKNLPLTPDKITFGSNKRVWWKFHIYLNDDEYSRVIQSLIRLKNSLIAQGRYTDGVDDVLCKVLSAKKRKVKIKYF